MYVPQDSYSYLDLIRCGKGELFGEGNARLPLPNMLMFDRVTKISKEGGRFGNGEVFAELDIRPSLWFFDCHFEKDPVMPGCLGLDATWQLLGFFLAWQGHSGKGRALGVEAVRFTGQVLPTHKKVRYELQIRRVISRGLVLGFADGEVFVDDQKEPIYRATGLKTGLFVTEDQADS